VANWSKLSEHPFYLYKDFRKLYLGRFVSGLGDKVLLISLSWWLISSNAAGGQLQLGVMMALTFLPVVLFGPFLGPLVDRFDRRRCMIIADAIRCFLFLLLGFLFYTGYTPLPLVFGCCFLAAALIPLFEAASNSSLLQLTSERHLASAAAFDSSVIEISNIAGALCVSVLVTVLGQSGIFFFNALTFVVSLLFVATIRIPLPPQSASMDDPAPESYREQFKSGFSFIWRDKAIFSLLGLFSALNLFISPIVIFIPIVVKEVLNQSISWVAALELAMSIGALLAFVSFSFVKRYKRIYGLYVTVLAVLCLAFMGLGAFREMAALLLCVFLFGALLAVVNGMSMILFQHGVPDEMKGRFFAILKTVCFAVIPVSLLLNGYLASVWPITGIIWLNGAGGLVLSLLVLFIPRIADEI